VRWILVEYLLQAGACVFELAGSNQVSRGANLRLLVVGQYVSRANVLPVCTARLVAGLIGFRQLESGLTESRVLLQRVAEFDDRFRCLALLQERESALVVLALQRFVAGAGRRQ
jgi:hypothetical protein